MLESIAEDHGRGRIGASTPTQQLHAVTHRNVPTLDHECYATVSFATMTEREAWTPTSRPRELGEALRFRNHQAGSA
jgi:hypothetical protein